MGDKRILRIPLSLDDYEEPSYLIAGLISNYLPFELANWLNRHLSIDLARSSDLLVEKIGKLPVMSFVRYRFNCQLHRFSLMLLANRQENSFFSPAHKKINFWFVLRCEEQDETDVMMQEIIRIINLRNPSDCFAIGYSSDSINHFGYFEQEH